MLKKIFAIGLLSFLGMGTFFVTPSFAGQSFVDQNTDFNPAVPSADRSPDEVKDSIITIIRNIVNYILGMLAFICLLLLLYAGWLYLTGKADDAIKRIRQVLIALLIIASSYFILSFIFYIITQFFGA